MSRNRKRAADSGGDGFSLWLPFLVLFANRWRYQRAFMRRPTCFLLILGALGLLGACAGGPQVSGRNFVYEKDIGEGYATLYVYRPYQRIGSCCWPELKVDGRPVANLGNGSYSVIHIGPGSYDFSFEYLEGALDSPRPVLEIFNKSRVFSFEAGREYFLKFNILVDRDISFGSIGGSSSPVSSNRVYDMGIDLVKRDIAMLELQDTGEIKPIVARVAL